MELEGALFSPALDGLSALRGHVLIRTPAAALAFVRLRTSIATMKCWHEGPYWFEVVDPAGSMTIPTYGIPVELGGYAVPRITESNYAYSIAGFLPPNVYKAGGYESPVVRTTAAGFDVIRWVWVYRSNSEQDIEQVEESIGRDGAYSWRVLSVKPPPATKDGEWRLYIDSPDSGDGT